MMVATFFGSAACVAVGACAGGMGRFALATHPGGRLGTWLANSAACVVLGVALGSKLSGIAPAAYLLVATGLAGALSTWSTFAAELGALLVEREWMKALGYLSGTTVTGLALLSSAAWAASWLF